MPLSTIDTSSISGLGYGFKNRILNGGMTIDQRNAGASVTVPATTLTYTVDRWAAWGSAASKYTVQQNAASVTPPTGFKNYLGATVAAAANVTIGSTDVYYINQKIEGFNTADLGWGAAGASTVTLSFWVRSSLTGTFGGSLYNSAADRSYPYTYTISAANTWEQKTVTITGDTSGTWLSTNGIGVVVLFSLGYGSTYQGTANTWQSGFYGTATGTVAPITTNNATFYITGVQIEKGTVATSFDWRPYGTELQLCQRYCYAVSHVSNTGFLTPFFAASASVGYAVIPLPVQPRVPPTGVVSNSNWYMNNAGPGNAGTGALVFTGSDYSGVTVQSTSGAGMTAGYSGWVYASAGTTATLYTSGSEL